LRIQQAGLPKIIRGSTRIPQESIKQGRWLQPNIVPRTIGARREVSMKKQLVIATTVALGLAGACSVGFAQDETQTTNMQKVTVTLAPGEYETYVADLNLGYGLEAHVGNTHRQYMRAQRAAQSSEALRMSGMSQRSLVTVAIDNSSAPGVAKQIRLIGPARDTVAIVNVYCKRVVSSGGKHCLLTPLTVRGNTYSQRLASTQAGRLQLAEVDLHD